MNRRRFLGAIAGAVGVGGGYAGLRVGDLRPYDPEPPSGETPRERIVAAARHRYAADHRAVTRVEITRDSAGEAGYDAARARELHEHSRRRHTHVYTTTRTPPGQVPHPFNGILGLFHWNTVDADEVPRSSVVHLTDGAVVASWDAPTTAVGERPRLGDDATAQQVTDYRAGMLGEFVRPHRAEWTRVADGRYEVTALDAYAQVPTLPSPVESLGEGCRFAVSLDERGRLASVTDERVVTYAPAEHTAVDADERTVGYRIRTAFDRYGTASAPRPRGDAETTTRARLGALLQDLERY
ncbi:hypothetical protein [Haloarcula litorea]|uniref:hypothetical protein n=1 Tax=Haloarcula litorea TaxID=3032579 RepID=UPI0023E7901D|nr:hypothetical protein [Halomicroarcula sp. GDY20]